MDRTKSIPLQAPTCGNLITILSIDGGGIRELIPGTILGYLESELQALVVTAMLATPDENNRPVFAAKDIEDFYLTHCPKIFPQKQFAKLLSEEKWLRLARSPVGHAANPN